ncbi:MAG TPA: hypothetical protein VJY34_01120 [Roseiarcus sp.]|nr:hypothetical protein [Roseiarcus sp.]
MALPYGFVQGKMTSEPAPPLGNQHHQHLGLLAGGAQWDVGVNVGTSDSDGLLKSAIPCPARSTS